jgi:hypothetical protein
MCWGSRLRDLEEHNRALKEERRETIRLVVKAWEQS